MPPPPPSEHLSFSNHYLTLLRFSHASCGSDIDDRVVSYHESEVLTLCAWEEAGRVRECFVCVCGVCCDACVCDENKQNVIVA